MTTPKQEEAHALWLAFVREGWCPKLTFSENTLPGSLYPGPRLVTFTSDSVDRFRAYFAFAVLGLAAAVGKDPSEVCPDDVLAFLLKRGEEPK